MNPIQPTRTDSAAVSPETASIPEDSGSTVFFSYHSVEFAVRVQKGNEAPKVKCTGLGHLIEDVLQCPFDGHLMCRKCCFPPGEMIPVRGNLVCRTSFPHDEIISVVCHGHQNTPLFYDKLAGRSIRTQTVTCPANEVFNVACPWKGQYNEVTIHLDGCTFIPGPARVAMQNSMLKEADQRADQRAQRKYEELKNVTDLQIERIQEESDRKYNALKLLSDQRNLELMQKINELENQLKNLPLQQTSQPAVINPPAQTPPALAATTVEEDRLPPFMDGKLTWKISDISLKLELARTDPAHVILYSPVFYTSQTGYKIRVKLYPAGDGIGKGTHMSIYFQIMKGPYDGLLTWPFKHRVSFELLDQYRLENVMDSFRPNPLLSSFKRPGNQPNSSPGCPLFVSLLDLNKHGYLRDDTMFIRVGVHEE